MLCEDARELLPVYIGGGLCESERRSVVAHLAVCAECRREVAMLLKLKTAHNALTPKIPKSIQLSAFDLIEEVQTTEETNALSKSLELLNEVFSVTRSTLRLTYRLISI